MNPLQIQLVIPDLWQQEAVRQLRAGRDVVVQAPTGAGKTYIFELLYPTLKGQAIYTVPTRALANDKLAEWRARGWDVGISTGDLAHRLDARVLVATLETQKGRFLRREGPPLLAIDEYQMIADPLRGVNYELAVALAPPTTQLLLLSGSVANPDDVVAWLRRLGRDAALVAHRERPVPLEEIDLLGLPDRAPAAVDGFWPRRIANALLAGLGPILVFAPRRHAAEQFAFSLAPWTRDPLALSREQRALAGGRLSRLLANRLAYHHSGLGYGLRAGLLEPLAKHGQLDVVVATMGLAAGINFSMRSVLVTDTRYFAANIEHHVEPDELLQMFGRAGRRGLDETGYVLVTPRLPRLFDARARHLKRARPLDWPMLIAVMRGAAARGDQPFAEAARVGRNLFADQAVAIGVEHCAATGPRACGLGVDMERARFARRPVAEMLAANGGWEPATPAVKVPLADVLRHDGRRWRPALSFPETLADPAVIGVSQARAVAGASESGGGWGGAGTICRLDRPGAGRGYGRQLVLATAGPAPAGPPATGAAAAVAGAAAAGASGPGGDRRLLVAKWLRKLVGAKWTTAERLAREVVPRLPELTGGARVAEAGLGGGRFVVRLDFGPVPVEARRDAAGRALWAPPLRESVPPPCRGCPDYAAWCSTVEIGSSPAHAWRQLGLVERDGTPTRRGIIFSFFNHGEGLAVAAALEDPSYPLADLVFDLANLRAGHRFAGLDSPYGGRLGVLCQQQFGRADYPGYLELGVPVQYGAGAAEVIRDLCLHRAQKHQLLSEELRPGDIERAWVEWRSLLRHITWAPDYDWDRWRELKTLAGRYVVQVQSPVPLELPPLLPAQSRRRGSDIRHP